MLHEHKDGETCLFFLLQLFKMEDVSMGMWVERFNGSMKAVQYSHNWKFCQYGCMEDYFTAHYQSPRQMLCLWDKLTRGRARCCNFRWQCVTTPYHPIFCIILYCINLTADLKLSRKDGLWKMSWLARNRNYHECRFLQRENWRNEKYKILFCFV